ncbi:MAG TPA: flagellar FlbD family protein [Bacillota bacterium]|jgi:flagellar protein FlbD|nr:flagellar FlbD family protein [Bacillota bacterium]
MIQAKRLNGKDFYINPHIIETIEETPNTVITFATGDKVLVLESAQEIIDRILQYRSLLGEAGREVIPANVFREDDGESKPNLYSTPT